MKQAVGGVMANFVSMRVVLAMLGWLTVAIGTISLTECGDLEPLPMATRTAI